MDEDDWLGDLFRDGDLAQPHRRRQPLGEATRGRPPDVEPERRERKRDVEPKPDRERRRSASSGLGPAWSVKAETPEVLEVEPGGDVDTSGNAEAQSTPSVTDTGQSGENQTSSRPQRNVAPPCRLCIDQIFLWYRQSNINNNRTFILLSEKLLLYSRLRLSTPTFKYKSVDNYQLLVLTSCVNAWN